MTENATCEHGKPIDHWCEECRRTDYEAARGAILAHLCECVSCADCCGTGHTCYRTGGYPEEEMETCDGCDGSGIVHQCDRCNELDELNQAYYPEEA